jgi:hypothetical protein
VLKFVKGSFNQIPLFVKLTVITSLNLAIGFGWNQCNRIQLLDLCQHRVRGISLVGQNRLTLNILQQCFCLGTVVDLPAGENKLERLPPGDYQNSRSQVLS